MTVLDPETRSRPDDGLQIMTYRRHDNVVARAVAGENVLIPVHGCTDSVYTLNVPGCRLWDLLAEARTEAELAASMASQYQIAQDRALADVRLFLADVVRLQLVTVVAGND